MRLSEVTRCPVDVVVSYSCHLIQRTCMQYPFHEPGGGEVREPCGVVDGRVQCCLNHPQLVLQSADSNISIAGLTWQLTEFFFSLYFNLWRWALSPALCASRPSPLWRLHFSRLQTTYAMLTHAWPSTRDPRTSRSSSPLASCEARPSSGSWFFFFSMLCSGDLQLTAHARHSCRKRHNNPLSSIGC